MKKKRFISTMGAAIVVFSATQSTNAQFFTNDLTVAASIPADFDEYLGSQANSTWTYVSDGSATDQNGAPNTIMTNGAVLNWVTNDDDTARSYLGTTYPNWMDHSWTAHIGIEAPASTKPYIFFGLGDPTPKESYYNEPQNGQSVFVSWQSGNSNSKISVKRNGSGVVNTGAWQGDPGYDIYMTYNHISKTVVFEVDNWNGGRFSGINVTTDPVSIDGYLTDPNVAHIFFGANAKVTFADFDVVEISSDTVPFVPENVYTVISNMAVDVKWDAAILADSYDVKRSTMSGSGYVTLASGLTDLAYTDTTIETNETYYYVVSATNAIGASENSDEVSGVGFPYEIIGAETTNPEWLNYDALFDNDVDTFYDYNNIAAYAGVDYGEDNAKRIMSVEYVLRDWDESVGYVAGVVIEGANSSDFSGAVVLYTIPAGVNAWPAVNTATITDTGTYRYVRTVGTSRPNYMMSEIDFITEDEVTANGTSTEWLNSYYEIPGTNSGVYFADYAEADVSDTDGDGLLAWEEYKLNGDPTDANSPAGANNLYVWNPTALETEVRWDSSALADVGGGYVIYRSLDDSTYAKIGTSETAEYTDSGLTAGVKYFYKASVTNAEYAHETALSASYPAVANEADIIGLMSNAGAPKTLYFYNLFDGDTDTFMDDNAQNGWGGLDYGVGNEKIVTQMYFWIRGGSFATKEGNFDIEVNGEIVRTTRGPESVYGNTFEGSTDGVNWNVIATITNFVPVIDAWNAIEVSSAPAYQYFRYYPTGGVNNYGMAEVAFLGANDFTASGTPKLWLDSVYDVAAEFGGDYEAADASDTDMDGLKAGEERVAGTDPTDAASVLAITSGDTTGTDFVLTWQSVEGKSYSIVTNNSLRFGYSPENKAVTGIDAAVGTNSTSYTYTNGIGGASAVFYEIGVE